MKIIKHSLYSFKLQSFNIIYIIIQKGSMFNSNINQINRNQKELPQLRHKKDAVMPVSAPSFEAKEMDRLHKILQDNH